MQLMMMQLKVEELKGKVGAQEVEIQRLTERTEQQKSSHQDGERKLKDLERMSLQISGLANEISRWQHELRGENTATMNYAIAEQMATGQHLQWQSQIDKEDDPLAKEMPSSKEQNNPKKSRLHAGISAKKKTNTQAKQNADRDSYKQPTHEISMTSTPREMNWKIFANIHKLKTMANEIFEQTQEMKPVFQLDTCPLQSKLTEFLEEIETLEKSVIAKDPSTGRAVHEAVEYSGVTSDSAVYSLPSSQST
jgi:hypothetical protein